MEPKVNIALTVAEWNVVMQALGKRPFEEIQHLIFAIQSQAKMQLEPPIEPTEGPKE